MNKIVINHLDKTFVTSDATVMVNELEVQHPAAKLVVYAAKSQENEVGDGTNMVRHRCSWLRASECLALTHSMMLLLSLQVLTLAGALLDKAAGLLKEGLTTTEVAEGYTKATLKVRLLFE